MTDPLSAELAYFEARATQQRIRSVRRALVAPLRLCAAADLSAAVTVLLICRDHMLLFFAPAYLLVLFLSYLSYRGYARNAGLWLPIWPWIAIIIPMLVASSTTSRLGFKLDEPWLTDTGPFVANVVAIGVTAAWLRSRRLAVAAAAMAIVSAGVIVLLEGDVAVSVQAAAYGVLLWHAAEGER